MMSNLKIPNTDSINELAQFCDRHDLTDFEDQLEKVIELVFKREIVMKPISQITKPYIK